VNRTRDLVALTNKIDEVISDVYYLIHDDKTELTLCLNFKSRAMLHLALSNELMLMSLPNDTYMETPAE
jgi:hypothetical protein